MTPRLLDLFCCQGGAGMGYRRRRGPSMGRHALRRRNGVTVHGATGYHRGCRCNECSAAHADKGRQDRNKKKVAT